MLRSLLFGVLSVVWPLLLRAQTIDPAFLPAEIYKPGLVKQIAQQPDGKILVLGDFVQVAHQPAPPAGLVRLLPDGSRVDTVFQRNVQGLTGNVRQFILLANGKILLDGANSPGPALQLGSIRRQAMLLLNSDGTPDSSFDVGTGPNAYIVHMVEQRDGRILVAGAITQFSDSIAHGVVRLLPNGAVDHAFRRAMPTLLSRTVGVPSLPVARYLALQSDGKILVGGDFGGTSVMSDKENLIRLLPTGAQDVTFRPDRYDFVADVLSIAVQPDNKLYVLQGSEIIRLQANGVRDYSFINRIMGSYWTGATDWVSGNALLYWDASQSRLLVIRRGNVPPSYNWSVGWLIALTPTGALDPRFNNLGAAPNYPNAICLTPTGKILVGGQPGRYGTPASVLTPLALLTSIGSRDAGFNAFIHTWGEVNTVALQPDGKLLVGGEFTEINGVAVAGGLARLHPDGQPDSLYCRTAAVDNVVRSLALQADGKVIIAGAFTRVGSINRPYMARLSAMGSLDTSFAPGFSVGSYPAFEQVALQSDGRVLVRGSYMTWSPALSNSRQDVVRLFSNGQIDPSFQTAATITNNFLLQNDGKIVASGTASSAFPYRLWRWLPDGTLDTAFSVTIASSGFGQEIKLLAQDNTERTYFYNKRPSAVGNGMLTDVVRLLRNGQTDASFSYSTTNQSVGTIAVQPNQRVLIATVDYQGATQPGTSRLLSSGNSDIAYQPLNGPAQGVSQMLVQPDGAIVMAGSFRTVAGLPINGITRLLDNNVLRISAPRAAIHTSAYPVPTHGELHLVLDAAAQPQQVQLLDALGRTVLRQQVSNAELILNLALLPAGSYVLRVSYASGSVTQRVVLE